MTGDAEDLQRALQDDLRYAVQEARRVREDARRVRAEAQRSRADAARIRADDDARRARMRRLVRQLQGDGGTGSDAP